MGVSECVWSGVGRRGQRRRMEDERGRQGEEVEGEVVEERRVGEKSEKCGGEKS